jgi:hypothetical protein
MITAQQALRYSIDKQLGGPGLTADARMRDALRARRCRSLFFNAIAPVVDSATAVADNIVQAQTEPFGQPVIITDILNFDEPYVAGFYPGVIWELMRVFTSGVGYQEDFFSAGSFTCSLFTAGHYQSNVVANLDAPSIKQYFMPYLMRPGQIFQFNWELMDIASIPGTRTAVCPEADLRSIKVLDARDPLGQLCGTLLKSVCLYIERYNAETFILDLDIPTASFPAVGTTGVFTTPLQERPLLIYGIGTNINGAQVTFRDDALRWEFVITGRAPTQAIVAGAPVAGVYPLINGMPLSGAIACNGDGTIHEAYNMLPVPHLLEPNTALTFRLTNGLRPDGTTGAYQQTMDTTSNSLHSTGGGHIAFLCRTV